MGRLCSFVFAGIVLAVMFAGSGLAATAQLSQADLAALAKGEPFVRVTRVAPPSVLGAAGKTLAGIDIKAPPEAVFAVLRDCKRIMRVIKSMTSCTVRKSDPKGLWEERVTSSAPSAVLPTFKSVSRFDFAPFRQIKFRHDGLCLWSVGSCACQRQKNDQALLSGLDWHQHSHPRITHQHTDQQ